MRQLLWFSLHIAIHKAKKYYNGENEVPKEVEFVARADNNGQFNDSHDIFEVHNLTPGLLSFSQGKGTAYRDLGTRGLPPSILGRHAGLW